MIVTKNAIRTARIEVIGLNRVQGLCDRLIAASQWFSVLPLPDDEMGNRSQRGES